MVGAGTDVDRTIQCKAVLLGIRMFLDLPDPLVRGTDPAPDPCGFSMTFLSLTNDVNVA
jgi:hypothetical protein